MPDGVMVRILGRPRLLIVSILIAAAVFLFFALGSGYHFGWGFQFLDAAIYFGLYVTGAMLIETLLVARRLWPQNSPPDEAARQQEVEVLMIYLIAIWLPWGLYALKLFS